MGLWKKLTVQKNEYGNTINATKGKTWEQMFPGLDITVDLRPIPIEYRPLVKKWYEWKKNFVNGKELQTLQQPIAQESGNLDELDLWGEWLPSFYKAFGFDSNFETAFTLYRDAGFYRLDFRQRNDRHPFAYFRFVDDALKFMFFNFVNGDYLKYGHKSIDVDLLHQGLAPGTSISEKEGTVGGTGAITTQLYIDGDPEARAVLEHFDAIIFSHLITMTLDELDDMLRKPIDPALFNGKPDLHFIDGPFQPEIPGAWENQNNPPKKQQ